MKKPVTITTLWTNPETGFNLLLTGKVYPGERATRTDDEYPDYTELTKVEICNDVDFVEMETWLYSPAQIAEREAAIYEAYQKQEADV